MRFLAKYGRWGMPIRPLIQEAYASGLVQVKQEAVNAYFAPGTMTPIEREIAIAHWTFNGVYQNMDEATHVPPDYRIGVFDTEQAQAEHGWSDELRVEVEAALVKRAEINDDIIVVHSTVPPPWPRYDEFRGTPQALVRRLVEDGHNLDAVLTYEHDHQNRPKIMEEIAKAIANPPVADEVEEEVIG